MITIPLQDIKEKIQQQSNLSEEDINNKIKAKLDQLSGLISEEGAAHIIANELGVKLVPTGEKLQVKNILAGMRNVEITGKVTAKYELREFQTEKRSGKVANFMLGDETGIIRAVLWNDKTDDFPKINEGDVIKIEGGYIRDNNGRKEIHLTDNATLTINPEGVEVKPVQREKRTVKKLNELSEGDENIEVLGTIVQVFDLRFFEIDPETGRRAVEKDGKYFSGDKEVPNISYAYVMNLFLDDGTENVRTVLWRNQVQRLLDMSHEQIVTFKDNPAEFENKKNELLGTIVKVVGKTKKNQSFDRLELVANLIFKDVDPDQEMKNLSSDKQERPSGENKKEEPAQQENKDADQSTENKSSEEPAKEEQEPQADASKDKEKKKESQDDDLLETEELSIEDLEDLDK